MAICADYAAEPINRLSLVIVTQNIAYEMRQLLRWSRLTDAPIIRLLLYIILQFLQGFPISGVISFFPNYILVTFSTMELFLDKIKGCK